MSAWPLLRRLRSIGGQIPLHLVCRGMSSAQAFPLSATLRGGLSVPVTAEPGISVSLATRALASACFADWAARLEPEMASGVSSLRLQSVDLFGPRVGFIKLVAEASVNGRPIPGVVFLRGGAVAILVVLRCEGARWALCVRQPRLACGARAFLELPAGMLDGSGDFAGVAAKEMAEETGLVLHAEELLDMTALAYGAAAPGVFPSVGACDEALRLLYYTKDVEPAFLAGLQGKLAGCADEGEQISLDLLPLDTLWQAAPDAKTLCALLLYERLRASGQLLA